MDGILEWGYDAIVWTQQFSPGLDSIFKVLTTLGAEQGFLLLLPLVFWCLDKRTGMRLGLLLMLSGYLNHVLKLLFDQPRPLSDRVKVMAEETSPGLPSGHSQNSVAVYGFLAVQVHQPWTWVLAGLITLSVGISRIYLGVHFPSDVLIGWLIGLAFLTLYLRGEPEVAYRMHAWPWQNKIALAVILPVAVFLVKPDEDSAQLMGVVLGLLVGILIELRWVKFSAGGPLWQQGIRFVFGAATLVVIWLGSQVLFPSEPESVALSFRLLRYGLVGAWASLGAPWLFVRLGLASQENEVSD